MNFPLSPASCPGSVMPFGFRSLLFAIPSGHSERSEASAFSLPRPAFALLLLFLAFAPSAFSQGNVVAPDPYQALVDRVKKGDQTVNFRDLRIAYSNSPAFTQGPDTSGQKKNMRQALNDKDYSRVIQNADVVLASDFVDMDAHFVEYLAYSELKNPERADFHKFVLQSLLKSIASSGDGKSPETAYVVISVDEEYVLLRFLRFGLPKKTILHAEEWPPFRRSHALGTQLQGRPGRLFQRGHPRKARHVAPGFAARLSIPLPSFPFPGHPRKPMRKWFSSSAIMLFFKFRFDKGSLRHGLSSQGRFSPFPPRGH
ncbi:MAG TPA: DUF4919 domain-containing protein [Terriglobales bacterium]|nr:DUF4919 domain-containing protein [Terriglobales bacterium]